MENTRHALWRRIPIEWYLIALSTGLTLFVLYRFGLNIFVASGILSKAVLFVYLFGGSFFVVAIFLLDFYCIGRFISILANAWLDGDKASRRNVIRMLGQYAILIVSLAVAVFDLGAMDGVVDNIWQSQKIITASNALSAVDLHVIGGYPMVLLGNFFARYGGAFLSIGAYNLMTVLMSLFLIYALFYKQSLARRFLLFFFITQAIAFPLWFAVPALSPYNFYTGGVSPQDVSASVMTQFSAYHPSGILMTELNGAEHRQAAARKRIPRSNEFSRACTPHGARVWFISGLRLSVLPPLIYLCPGSFLKWPAPFISANTMP